MSILDDISRPCAAFAAACALSLAAQAAVRLETAVDGEGAVPGAEFALRAAAVFDEEPDPRVPLVFTGLPFSQGSAGEGVRVSGAEEAIAALEQSDGRARKGRVPVAFDQVTRSRGMMSFQGSPVFFSVPVAERDDGKGGREWVVTVRSAALRASSPGTLTLPEITLREVAGQDLFGELRTRLVARSGALKTEIAPFPEKGRPAVFLRYAGTNISAKARLDAYACRAGDVLRATLAIECDDPALLSPPDLSVLSTDAFSLDSKPYETRQTGALVEYVYNVRARIPGACEFPALELGWYDTARKAYATVATQSAPVQVREAPAVALRDDYPLPDGMLRADGTPAEPMMPERRMLWILFAVPPLAYLALTRMHLFFRAFARVAARLGGAYALPRAVKAIRGGSPRAWNAVRAYFKRVHSLSGESVTAAEAERIMLAAGEDPADTAAVVKFLSSAETAAFSKLDATK